MSKGKFDSRELRQLAEEFLSDLGGAEGISEFEREDLVTSLVRQLVTYEGRATLFVGEYEFDLKLHTTPLGKRRIGSKLVPSTWRKILERERNVSPEDLPEIFAQLNRGQSVEFVNREGVALRMWVNPGKHSVGIEEVDKKPVPREFQRDLHKIATFQVEQLLGDDVDEEESAKLADSVARQWQKFEGHAGLFLDGQQVAILTFTEKGDGTCNVTCQRKKFNLEAILAKLGCRDEAIPSLIAGLNLGQRIELKNEQGLLVSTIMHNPQEGRIHVEGRGGHAPPKARAAPPIYCSQCSAVLGIWGPAQQSQRCPACGQEMPRD